MIALLIGNIHYWMKLFGHKKGILKDEYWYLTCLILESILELVTFVIL